MKHYYSYVLCVLSSLLTYSTLFGQITVSNPDFIDINWWGSNTTSVNVVQTDSGGSSPMEDDLGTNWRSNPASLPGRGGGRSILLGSDFSPVTGRDDWASLSLYDGGVIWTYLGQATEAGTVTIEWNTAARSDVSIPQDDLGFQFQTSAVGGFGTGWTPTVDAGGSSSYSGQGVTANGSAWQRMQYTSNTVNAGDHVYFYWVATGSSPASNQTLIQDISATFTPQHDPSYFFEPSDLAALQAAAATSPGQEYFEVIQYQADRFMSVVTDPYDDDLPYFGRNLQAQVGNLAFTGWITGTQSYFDKAKEIFMAGIRQVGTTEMLDSNGHLALADAAHAYVIGYDWIAHELTPSERAEVVARMQEVGDLLLTDVTVGSDGSNPTGRPSRSNLGWNHSAIVYTALYMLGVHLNNPGWEDLGIEKMQEYVRFAQDGSGAPYEGVGYIEYGITSAALVEEMYGELNAGADLYTGATGLDQLTEHLLHQVAPWGGEVPTVNQTGEDLLSWTAHYWLTQRNNDAVGFWAWERALGDQGILDLKTDSLHPAHMKMLPFLLLWQNSGVTAQAPAGTDLSAEFLRGHASMRSDWTSGAAHLTFESGEALPGAWDHPDVTSFTYVALGDRFIVDPGPSNMGNGSHSVVLVDGVGQSGSAGVTNQGELTLFEENTSHVFVAGDATRAYTEDTFGDPETTPIQHVKRQIYFGRSPEPFAVILDDVATDDGQAHDIVSRFFYADNLTANTVQLLPAQNAFRITGGRSGNIAELRVITPGTVTLTSGQVDGDNSRFGKHVDVATNGTTAKIVSVITTADTAANLPTVTSSANAGGTQIQIAFSGGTATVQVGGTNPDIDRNADFVPSVVEINSGSQSFPTIEKDTVELGATSGSSTAKAVFTAPYYPGDVQVRAGSSGQKTIEFSSDSMSTLTGTLQLDDDLVVTQTGTGVGSVSNLSGSGDISFDGGTLQVEVYGTMNNAHTGTTFVRNGTTLRSGRNWALSENSLLHVEAGGSFDLVNSYERVGGLEGSGAIEATGSRGILYIDNDAQDRTFSGQFADTVGPILHEKNGRTVLSGTNSYKDYLSIDDGVVYAVEGVGLSSSAALVIGDGILESSGTLTRTADFTSDPGTLYRNVSKSGGFAARGGALTVNLNGDGTTFSPGGDPFLHGWSDHTIKFGSDMADNVVTFQNGLSSTDQNSTARNLIFRLLDNTASTADRTVISGPLSGAGGIYIWADDQTTMNYYDRSTSIEFAGDNSALTGLIQVTDGSLLKIGHANALGTADKPTYLTELSALDLNGYSISGEDLVVQQNHCWLINSDTSATSTFAGNISGDNILFFGGDGELVLTGDGTGTSTMATKGSGLKRLSGTHAVSDLLVQEGILDLDGVLTTGNLSTYADTRLLGSGTVGGDLTLNSSSTFEANDTDTLNVGQDVTLAGALVFYATLQSGSEYTIISAATVNGSFDRDNLPAGWEIHQSNGSVVIRETSNPFVPEAPLSVSLSNNTQNAQNNQLEFSFLSSVGATYEIYYCDDLSNGEWIFSGYSAVGDDQEMMMSMPMPSGIDKRFYKIFVID